MGSLQFWSAGLHHCALDMPTSVQEYDCPASHPMNVQRHCQICGALQMRLACATQAKVQAEVRAKLQREVQSSGTAEATDHGMQSKLVPAVCPVRLLKKMSHIICCC